jgi:hypothetical protein
MEKRLYPSIALTMNVDVNSVLENQQAKPIVISVIPASFASKMEVGSINIVPSKEETTIEGTITNAKPVAPSISAVKVKSDFNLLIIYI